MDRWIAIYPSLRVSWKLNETNQPPLSVVFEDRGARRIGDGAARSRLLLLPTEL